MPYRPARGGRRPEHARASAIRTGAVWAGDSTAPPPEPLDAAILFAPVGALLPAALRALEDANAALDDLRAGRSEGVAVLVP